MCNNLYYAKLSTRLTILAEIMKDYAKNIDPIQYICENLSLFIKYISTTAIEHICFEYDSSSC